MQMSQLSNYESDNRVLDMIQNNLDVEKGYKILIDHYKEQLYKVIHRMTRHHQDTDDILQNTFIKVFRHIGKFERNAKLYTWIYRIAVNETYTFLESKKKKQKKLVHLESANFIASADVYMDSEDVQRRLASAIEQLPPKQKMVFNLRYYEEMPYHDMSKILDTSEGALKASFHHAVKKIEKHVLKNELI